jgi:hypothetical protein
MDLHPPGGPVRSLKDFFIHIGVVTPGILIALGLEQLVESHHRAHLADAAIATQALTYLPFDAVARYAQAYGAVRLFIDTERDGLTIWEGMHRFSTDLTALSKEQRTLAIACDAALK